MSIHIYSHYAKGQTVLSNLPRLFALGMPLTASPPLGHDLYDVGERGRLGAILIALLSHVAFLAKGTPRRVAGSHMTHFLMGSFNDSFPVSRR